MQKGFIYTYVSYLNQTQTETFGFGMETESLAAFGLKSKTESYNKCVFSFEPNQQFKQPNSKYLKEYVEPQRFCPNQIIKGQDNMQD